MRILKNELSWSFSRDRLFRDCKRAYYYNYYASWGWWKETADEFTQKANILKKMKNLAMWRGEIVHDVIKWVLEERRKGRRVFEEIANMKARNLLRKGWTESKNKEWVNDSKKVNIFEHYYNKPIEKERIDVIKERVYGCIKNFHTSNFLKRLNEVSYNDILQIEDIEHFIYKGLKVYVSPDFALKSDNYYLFDWKTGNVSEDDKLQLSCYGLFGIKKWDVTIDNIKIVPVYLNKENLNFKPLGKIDIEGVEDYIDKSVEEMKSLLKNVEFNDADIDDFPMVSEKSKCGRCSFQELCNM